MTRYRGGVGHRYRLGGRRSGVGKRTRSPPFSSAGPPCFFLYLVVVPRVRHALLCAGPFGATAVNLCSIHPNKTDIVRDTRANNSTKNLEARNFIKSNGSYCTKLYVFTSRRWAVSSVLLKISRRYPSCELDYTRSSKLVKANLPTDLVCFP